MIHQQYVVRRAKDKKELARMLKDVMKTRREKPKGSLKDIEILINCRASGNYTLMYNTKLYTNYGAEYTEYLILLQEYISRYGEVR